MSSSMRPPFLFHVLSFIILFFEPMLTPYGGSVKTMSASSPCITLSRVSFSALSPQIRRCSPRIHISPGFVIASAFSASSSEKSSSSDSVVSSRYCEMSSNPKSDIFISAIFSSSAFRSSSSHSASSAALLSARRNAFICSSLKSSAIMQGTVSSPSFFAAFNLV